MGGKRGIRGKWGIAISTHNGLGGTWGKQYNTENTSSDSIASYYAVGQ